jgi:hypothetical protein
MTRPRPATFGQAYRLNTLGCFKLVGPGEGEVVEAEKADLILREAAARGLFTPARSDYPRPKKRSAKHV